jgi:hypothetical protein
MLYGPIKRQGLGLKDPYILQGLYHIRDMQEHLWKQTTTGQFYKISLEQLRLELGSNIDKLQSNYDDYKNIILTESLVQDTWRFMSKNKITMLYNISSFRLQCIGDKMIMDEVLKLPLSKTEQQDVNKCSIYLQVLSLADIATGNGKNITNDAFIGRRRKRQSNHNYQWPNWGQPSFKQWKAWRKALKLAFAPTRHRKLLNPLGAWTNTISSDWEWYETVTGEEILFQHTNNQTWLSHKKLGRSQRVKRYKMTGSPYPHPPHHLNVRPTTIVLRSNCIESEGHRQQLLNTPSEANNDTTPPWLHYRTIQSPSIMTLINDIKRGTARAVSDGSYFPDTGIGTAAWTIESDNKLEYITGTSIVPGPPLVQSAYRSEITGLLAILEKLRKLCKNHDIVIGEITISCDGLTALNQALTSHPLSQSANILH